MQRQRHRFTACLLSPMELISHHGQAQGSQVEPHLMRSSGPNIDPHQGRAFVALPIANDAIRGLSIRAQSREGLAPAVTKSNPPLPAVRAWRARWISWW